MLDYKTPIDFCVEHKVGIEGFFFAYLLYLDKRAFEGLPLVMYRPKVKGTDGRPLSQIFRYAETVRKWSNSEIARMVEKGFLKESPPKDEIERRRMGGDPRYIPDYMEVTPKFADRVMATYGRFEEYWNEYPAQIAGFNNPAQKVTLKAVDKDEVEKLYYKRVKTRSEHDRLMRALRWAIRHGKVNMNVKNYIAGENWHMHLEEMERDGAVGSTVI